MASLNDPFTAPKECYLLTEDCEYDGYDWVDVFEKRFNLHQHQRNFRISFEKYGRKIWGRLV